MSCFFFFPKELTNEGIWDGGVKDMTQQTESMSCFLEIEMR